MRRPIHEVRHNGYQDVHKWRSRVQSKSDYDISSQLSGYPDLDTPFLRARTGLRVKLRVYAQEAHRRGLRREKK